MAEQELKVLLIGGSVRGFSHITDRLEKSGCQCRFAKSYEEAHQFLSKDEFSLVLSAVPPRDNAISSIVDALADTRASIFYALPVEESCWWLPALRQGERCIGAPALRPSEFSIELDEVVAEIRARHSPGHTVAPAPIREEMPVVKQARKTHA